MKIFFDTNVYIAEALLGAGAEQIIEATHRASWRIFANDYLLEEVERVMTEQLRFSRRLAMLLQQRIVRRAQLVPQKTSRHHVPQDPKDSPILQAAISCGSDYLVTNDRHLLALNPYDGLRIISMAEYHRLLKTHGLLD